MANTPILHSAIRSMVAAGITELAATVDWYREHRDRWEPLKAEAGL